MAWTNEWKKVVFTDEKKFNFDGPDGYKCYFHDLRKKERFLSRRQCGGGSIMLWGSISYNGALSLVKISGHQNATNYVELLDQELGVMNDKLGDGSWIFQQDNAPIHTAKIAKEWFTNKNVTVLQWPAKSPDLNIIENVWGHLSRVLYENVKQYDSLRLAAHLKLFSFRIVFIRCKKMKISFIYRTLHKDCCTQQNEFG